MSSMIAPIALPIASIQHDFNSVIIDVREGSVPSEDFWISCYRSGQSSVHGKVRAELDDIDRNKVKLHSRGGVEIYEQGHYSVACPQLGIPRTKLSLPTRVFPTLEDGTESSNPRRVSIQITAFDIAPDCSQIATGYNDGTVLLQSAQAVKFQNTSKPHVSALTSLRFFPSSRVLLTASADFSLSIIPAEPMTSESRLSPARILKGHRRSITDTAIISRGKNLLSCAKDGAIRLWDVGGGQTIRTLGANQGSAVLSMSLGTKGDVDFGLRNPDDSEVDTSDKVVFCALGNGSLEVFDLGAKLHVQKVQVDTQALNAVCYSPSQNLVATGSIDGIITIFDTRALSSPVTSFTRNSSSIEDLAFTHTDGREDGDAGLVIVTEDGLPYVAGIRPEGPTVLSELVGTDCDAVRIARVASDGTMWTAGDDGMVRRY